jgi:hypothetical protein
LEKKPRIIAASFRAFEICDTTVFVEFVANKVFIDVGHPGDGYTIAAEAQRGKPDRSGKPIEAS